MLECVLTVRNSWIGEAAADGAVAGVGVAVVAPVLSARQPTPRDNVRVNARTFRRAIARAGSDEVMV
jgi:hypothetical protein